MTAIKNTSVTRLVLAPDFILDAGQERDATETQIKGMNEKVLKGLVDGGKLTIEGLANDKKAADDKKAAGGGMPTPGK